MDKINRNTHTKTWKDIVYYLGMTSLMTIFVVSGAMLLKNYVENRGHDSDLNTLAAIFPDIGVPAPEGDWGLDAPAPGLADTGKKTGQSNHAGPVGAAENDGREGVSGGKDAKELTIPPKAWKRWWEQEAESRFAGYQALKAQNSDMAGWIRLEGTRIDYPVVQTPDRPDYYLHRDFQGKNSNYGIPYMAENCRYGETGTGLLIYGHHMRDGGMFAALQNYAEESYYRQHPYIQFDTVDRAGSYQIAAVVKVDAADSATPWQDLLFPKDKAGWETAWNVFKQQSFYRTGVALEYEDRLLALVTCEYTLKDGRLMVVAKEIR